MTMRNEAILFRTINDSINILSIEGTIDILERGIKNKYSDESVQFVLRTITDVVNISIEQLSNPSVKDDRRKVTIGFCGYFLSTEYEYSYPFIAEKLPFGLCAESVRNYSMLIRRAKLDKPKSDLDKLISDYYFTINELIKTQKSKHTNNEKYYEKATVG